MTHQYPRSPDPMPGPVPRPVPRGLPDWLAPLHRRVATLVERPCGATSVIGT